MASKLDEARAIINEVDSQMADLFVKRMEAAELVYAYKKDLGLPIFDRAREEAVIEQNAARIGDDVLKEYYIDYLKHLMSLSRAYQYRLQKDLKAAYCGTEGSAAHTAAKEIFPGSSPIPYRDHKAAYDSVVSGESDVAVLPIEAGDEDLTLDLVFSGGLFINGIYELDTAPNPPAARFAVLSGIRANSPVLPHSVLMLALKDGENSLTDAIDIVEKHGFRVMTRRSQPLNGDPRQTYFCIEVDGRTDTENGAKMTAELEQMCSRFKIAGIFSPHAKL